jgi:hypothetical protein
MDCPELKTPSQVLQLLKKALNKSKRFQNLSRTKFIDKDRVFKAIYDLILDNFKVTGKAFILEQQVDIAIKNDIQLSLSDSILNLVNSGLLSISHINEEGNFVYKITELGQLVHKNIINEEQGKSSTKI